MKTNRELVKSLRIGDKFYYMDYNAASIDAIKDTTVNTLYLNGQDGKINNWLELYGDHFRDKNSYWRVIVSDNYEDLLCVVKGNAKRKISEQLEAITQICEQIAQYKATIHTCDNMLCEKLQEELKEEENK